ncbi:hypothetical protein ARMGADRAFT_1022903 [Armillaria gallica]|uniref:Uncharacterized protein n=1 Tax=Armillaria gallica TaxID=47427 RepID=A0A2H3EAQ3_ARMGA|nr:hypothetical protein ARMGADRAFT_1022903 [Armillaria gallica]
MVIIESPQSVQFGTYKNVEGGFSKIYLQLSTRLADNVPHASPSPIWRTIAKRCVHVKWIYAAYVPELKLSRTSSRETCMYEGRQRRRWKMRHVRGLQQDISAHLKRFRRRFIPARVHPTVFPTADISIVLLSFGHQLWDDSHPEGSLSNICDLACLVINYHFLLVCQYPVSYPAYLSLEADHGLDVRGTNHAPETGSQGSQDVTLPSIGRTAARQSIGPQGALAPLPPTTMFIHDWLLRLILIKRYHRQ